MAFPSKAVSNLLFLSKINLLDCINVVNQIKSGFNSLTVNSWYYTKYSTNGRDKAWQLWQM